MSPDTSLLAWSETSPSPNSAPCWIENVRSLNRSEDGWVGLERQAPRPVESTVAVAGKSSRAGLAGADDAMSGGRDRVVILAVPRDPQRLIGVQDDPAGACRPSRVRRCLTPARFGARGARGIFWRADSCRTWTRDNSLQRAHRGPGRVARRGQAPSMKDGYQRGRLPSTATPAQMNALAAYVAAGGSVSDAAKLVGIQPNTVKRRLADLRARSGLTTERSRRRRLPRPAQGTPGGTRRARRGIGGRGPGTARDRMAAGPGRVSPAWRRGRPVLHPRAAVP
jgi:hypothetical protein